MYMSMHCQLVLMCPFASFTQTLVTSVDNDNFDLDFNNDGTKMYIQEIQMTSIYEYDLSIGFDISLIALNQDLYVGFIDDEPFGIEFNTDGTRMFIVGTKGNGVDEFKLTTGFDISNSPTYGILFCRKQSLNTYFTDGTKMFIVGNVSDLVKSYDIGTSYRVSQDNDPEDLKSKCRTWCLVDGSVLRRNSKHRQACCFHSVTFITLGAIGLRMKDGVRVEWLNPIYILC